MKNYRILAINPGSTSTKIAVFDNREKVNSMSIMHEAGELAQFKTIAEQKPFRLKAILDGLKQQEIDLDNIDIFVGRGGGQETMESGTYEVTRDSLLYEHARIGYTAKHPASLGVVLVGDLADRFHKRAFTVNPPSVDEAIPEARFTGIKGLRRCCYTHALNQKEVAKRYAEQIETPYEDLNMIIAHIGGGISVTAHQKGRMIDSNDCLGNSGPMAPTRCGTVPAAALINMCFSGRYTEQDILSLTTQNGGVVSHLGTSDMREVEKMVLAGDEYAVAVFHAMVYQIEKEIGAMYAALKGKTDVIILTGGVAYDRQLVDKITTDLQSVAPVVGIPGEFEMEALVHGALAVLNDTERLKTYSGEPMYRTDWFNVDV